MKKINLLSVIFVLSFCGIFFSACRYKKGNGNIVTESRNTGSFNGISVSGDFEVEVKNGNQPEVIIEADNNLIKNIETIVVQGTLRIRSKDMNLHNAHFKAFITAPGLNYISASASANINVKDQVQSEKTIVIKASSSGEITAGINAPGVNAESSSGASVTLTGRTKDFKGTSSSGASIHAVDLLSENSIVSCSSGATIKVHASVSLQAEASSGANISYRGGGTVKKSTSSGGEIDKED